MKPILFSAEMVRAIQDLRKTQTRRVCKALENYDFSWGLDRKPYIGDYRTFAKVAPRKWDNVTLENVWLYDLQTAVDESKTYVLKPSYKPGDILWVRETWAKRVYSDNRYYYKADDNLGAIFNREGDKWRPSIFMPREAARIFLRVKNVRVERVQDITDADILAEGFECREDFIVFWNILNEKRGHGWNKNDWVYAYTFEKISREEAKRLEGMK